MCVGPGIRTAITQNTHYTRIYNDAPSRLRRATSMQLFDGWELNRDRISEDTEMMELRDC